MTLYDRILNGLLRQCSGRIRWTGRRSIVRIAAVDVMEPLFLKAGWLNMAPVVASHRRGVGFVGRV
jgi:hypothetical protein